MIVNWQIYELLESIIQLNKNKGFVSEQSVFYKGNQPVNVTLPIYNDSKNFLEFHYV